MFISAMLGTAATTRYLLDHGADPTIAGSKGSALHGAVMAGMTYVTPQECRQDLL